ncbi:MAG: hypothetical protein E6G94_14755 [Alphaproteobacteria bacterium]|nr:MAG: hypothetical protein E6G94_14755 [Alphaproteobacteria bacterium]
MDEREAAEALAAMQAARGRMAGRARWSFWRHAAVGLLMGALVASYALPAPLTIAVVGLCLLGVAAIVARDRRRDGFFVSGYRRGRTRPLTFGLVAFLVAALLLALISRQWVAWAPVAIGAVVAVVATGASIVWERIYQRELGDG